MPTLNEKPLYERKPNQITEPKIPRFVTIRQAAATGILPEHTLRRFVKDGTIPSIKSGNRNLLNLDRLIAQLEEL